MKTGKCEEMLNRILTGDRSEEVMRHLSECSDCRGLAALDQLTAGLAADRMEVPVELDRRILSCAAAKKRPSFKVWEISFVLRHAAIPAAAAVMVCAGLFFALRPLQNPVRNSLVQVQNQNQNQQYDLDSVDSEVLMLSSRIQATAAQLSRTAVYSAINE